MIPLKNHVHGPPKAKVVWPPVRRPGPARTIRAAKQESKAGAAEKQPKADGKEPGTWITVSGRLLHIFSEVGFSHPACCRPGAKGRVAWCGTVWEPVWRFQKAGQWRFQSSCLQGVAKQGFLTAETLIFQLVIEPLPVCPTCTALLSPCKPLRTHCGTTGGT